MDPASLTLAVFGAVIELYKFSMKTYDLYLSIQDFTPAFRHLRLALDIERKRLELWAQHMGLDKESGMNDRLRNDASLLEIIQDILGNMAITFNDSAKLLEEYMEPPPTDPTEAKKPDISRRIPPATRKTWENASKYLKWATRDKKKLEQLVKSLKRHNNSLDHLATNVAQAAMRRTLRTQFIATDEIDQLKLLEETAIMVGHEDLEHVASTKRFVRQTYQSEELCATLEATKLQTQVEPATPDADKTRNWILDIGRLHYEGVAIMTDHSRTLGTYCYDDGEKEAALAVWSSCRDDSWRRHNPVAFRTRVSNLVKILNQDLLAKGFRVLRCIGYVQASSTKAGYLYQPPPEAVEGSEPISLYDILSKVETTADIPVLGDRFELAKAIVTTVFEFHNVGWMHKNIQPNNILFWHSKEVDGDVNIRKPYLVGFDLSRSNQPGEISEKPIPGDEDDLYRHPAYKGASAGVFKPSYDFYSLGILLFEIAMWRLVSKTQSQRSKSRKSSSSSSAPAVGNSDGRRKSSIAEPNFIQTTVMALAQDLGRYVGAKYRDAVLACIQFEFDDVWDLAGADERNLKLQQAIQPKVVDAIDFCQA